MSAQLRPPSGSSRSSSRPGPRAWIGIGVLLALCGIAAAGWLGYRHHLAPTPGASPADAAATGAGPGAARGVEGRRAASGAGSAAPLRADTPQADTPAAALVQAPAASQSALAWPLWEFQLKQPVPPRDPPLTPVPWRLIGATQSGGTWQIVVIRQGKPAPEYFKKGDSLPGGYRIASITEEDVTLVKGGRPVILSYISAR